MMKTVYIRLKKINELGGALTEYILREIADVLHYLNKEQNNENNST